MMMTTWRSCITATAVAVGAFMAGCGSSTPTSSGTSSLGESCQSSFDCKTGLVCIALACQTGPSTSTDGGVTPDGGGKTDGGTPGKDSGTPPPPVDSGFAGASPLGGVCTQTTDCAAGLVCVEGNDGYAVCDLASFGLTPTGKVCGGQCSTAADCYYLPVDDSPYGVTCQDILTNYLAGSFTTTCGAATPGGAGDIPRACFYYKTYCQPASAQWTCNTNSECVFTGACSVAVVNNLGGCPSETRTGATPVNGTLCDTTTMKCTAAAASECMTADDCNTGALTVADHPAETCGGDCICYSGSCYDACTTTLDCAVGYSCNTTTKLCELAPTCTTNADCVAYDDSATAVCNKTTGTCGLPCTNDHDCSRSSGASVEVIDALGYFYGEVCNTKLGVCAPVGCTSSTDCTGSSVNTLCVTAPAPSATPAVQSAITN